MSQCGNRDCQLEFHPRNPHQIYCQMACKWHESHRKKQERKRREGQNTREPRSPLAVERLQQLLRCEANGTRPPRIHQ